MTRDQFNRLVKAQRDVARCAFTPMAANALHNLSLVKQEIAAFEQDQLDRLIDTVMDRDTDNTIPDVRM